MRYNDDKKIIFHNALPNEVQSFIDEYQPILLGHNAKYYDQFILKGVLAGYTPEEIKEVNDYIIKGGQGFEIDFGYVQTPPIWDTIQDIVPMKSLKEIEGCLLLDITETTLSFDSPTKWTKEEYEEVLYYCEHDVSALKPLFKERYNYFKTKFDLCMLSNIDPKTNIGLTNAKLCAKFLEATMIKRDDERNYVVPKSIDTSVIPKEILNFFDKINDKSISNEELFGSKLDYNFHGMPSVFAHGGAHGAIPNFKYSQEEEPDMVVINADFASLYPHLLALPQYNYISRNIKDKNAYYNTLQRRLQLKHEGKKQEQLPLKLILNTTYGCQNNKYNDLYDPRGARGTCYTGQLLITELTQKIYNIGNVQLIQLNTDGIMVKLPKNKLDEYYKVCNDFSKKCGIELEYDIIKKIIQRDVNNYCMQYGDENHTSIKAKGGCFGSLPDIKIKENGELETSYKPNYKVNSLAIVSEALLKYLLFNIPIRETIENDNIIAKYQIITHLGGTYKKCVQESPNGDIEINRNNRIYSGKIPSGNIIKIKPDGRRDSLANCPTNPIVDNANKCTIEDINKEWYIELAELYANDFLGIKRLEDYKKDELLSLAQEMGLDIDKKTKKEELIKIIKNKKKYLTNKIQFDTIDNVKGDEIVATKQELEEKLAKSIEQNEKLVEKLKEREENKMDIKDLDNDKLCFAKLLHKINDLRKYIRSKEFILDKELPSNLGGGEYHSIGQYYDAIQDGCLKVGLDFSFETIEVLSFEKELVKPSGKLPIHVVTVKTRTVLTDIDTGESQTYFTIAQGSDTMDKAVSGAETMAFRQWFTKNFSPKGASDEEDVVSEEPKSEAPKVPVYVPETKKEEIKKEVVKQVQQESSDDEDVKVIIDNIMAIREKTGDQEYGIKTLEKVMSGTLSSADLMEIDMKIKNKMEKVGL